ncbi:MAG: hypothetical protein ACI8TP_001754 [Acidimicrobiales bacterium]
MSLRWRLAVLVGFTTLVLSLPGVWARSTYGAQVSVDEPQYLLTALSLAEDGDLDISDELLAERYRTFHELELSHQTTELDESGRQVSPHDPLLPLLLAPATSAWGFEGARVMLAVIAALTAIVTFLVAVDRHEVAPGVAATVVLAFFAAAPLAPYATQIYPEMTAALLGVLGYRQLSGLADAQGRQQNTNILTLVVLISALPWLAVKYVPIAASLGFSMLWQLRSRRCHRLALISVGALAASAAFYLILHQQLYGGWTVYAAGDHFIEAGEFSVMGTSPNYVGRVQRLLNLMVDRRFGLIPWNPAWVAAPAAMVWATTSSKTFRVNGAPAVAAGYSTATFLALTMHGWWSPGRQIVAILPLVVIAVAIMASHTRWLLPPLMLLGFLGAINWLTLAWESTTGRRTIVVDFWETSALPYRALDGVFPDLVLDERPAPLQMLWLALILTSMAMAGHAARHWLGRYRIATPQLPVELGQ